MKLHAGPEFLRTLIRSIFILIIFSNLLEITHAGDRAVKLLKSSDRKIALVIGNARYNFMEHLENPGNDAMAMKYSLESIGFEVELRLDGTREQILQDFVRFGEKISRKGFVGLFFYAGHGIQIEDLNYLVPVDATLEADSAPDHELVPLSMLMDQLKISKNGANIIIIDACRNNPYIELGKYRRKGLSESGYPRGKELLIAHATGPGEVAYDGSGANSFFTESLRRRITEPGRKIEDVFKLVVSDVKRDTKDQQQPWVTFSLTSDVCLVSCPGEVSDPPTPPIEKKTPATLPRVKVPPKISPPVAPIKPKFPTEPQVIQESRFRIFLDYGMPSLTLIKSSPTEKDRYGRPEKDRETYGGSGGGLSVQYFFNNDFSTILKVFSADLDKVTLTSESGRSEEISGKGRMDFQSLSIAYNWGGERDSWLGEWWTIYLGLGFSSAVAELRSEFGQKFTVSTMSNSSIIGFDYRTTGDLVFGSAFVTAMNNNPSGTRVDRLEDQGYEVTAFSTLSTVSIGYQFP